jgi:hypothetical protein
VAAGGARASEFDEKIAWMRQPAGKWRDEIDRQRRSCERIEQFKRTRRWMTRSTC